jgi:hypothetical protein
METMEPPEASAAVATPEEDSEATSMLVGLNLTSSRFHYEHESLYVESSGNICTEDGRTISFSMDLSMERTTTSMTQVSVAAQALIDPLVLSFSGEVPSFSSCSFQFDLDGDGEEEEIMRPACGCGFLALDHNADGRINDGLELFGPSSGSGFGELAAFDSDANLWIDENDPIFDQLLVWMQGDGGEGELLSLAEAGVGAIAVQNAETPFQLQNSAGETIGEVAATGLFITEDGQVRSMQEIDLAVQGEEAAVHRQSIAESEEAIFALREILSLQRLKMRLMLARTRLRVHQPGFDPLQRIVMALEEQQERFASGLDSPDSPADPLLATIIQQSSRRQRSELPS